MSAFDWSRLEDLFHRAAALAPSERSGFLDTECNGDVLLRREIESLLEHDAEPGSGFQTAVEQETEVLARQNSESFIGRRIGAYRVTGVIGEGGMGAVYRAVRDDDQYSKEVAVKLVRQGFETPALVARFRGERQILASLEHPYVARLLDGGVTSDGLPYLVMEVVEGVPITQYAAAHALPVEARLRLFQKVSEAVQYAHSRLVVHRDLKPGNILITSDGTPKLLDFGIAKLLTDASQSRTDSSRTLRLLTPDYASPEQVRGMPATVATDIYSLGAVLYELLTGRPPHQVDNSTPAEIERAVCLAEPALPSQAAGLATAPSRRLRGDLDNIALMALRKEPQRRYRSVEQFSEDIERHLSGRPVIARPDTFVYRSGKFTRRNWLPLTAAAAVAIALLGGVIESTIQARRAEHRFEQVRRLARTVLFDIHDQIADVAGTTAARQTIARTALEYLSSLSAEGSNDPALEAELAEAYRRVGDVQGNPVGSSLGDAAGAMNSYRRSVDLYTRAAGARPNDLKLQTAFAQALLQLGYRQNANGDRYDAKRSYAAASRIFDEILVRDLSYRSAIDGSATTSEALSRVLVDDNDYRGALAAATKAVDIGRRLVQAEPSNPSWRDALASYLSQLGACLIRTGDLEKAVDAHRQGLEIRERLLSEDPGSVSRSRLLMLAASHLGEVLGSPHFPNVGDTAGARIQFQRMVDVAESLASKDPANRTAQMDRAQAHMRMAGLLEESEPQASLANYRIALDLFKGRAAADPHTLAIELNRAFIEGSIGAILASQGHLEEGIVRMREAVKINRSAALNQPRMDIQITLLAEASDLALALARSHRRAEVDELRAEIDPSLKALQAAPVSNFTAARGPRTFEAFGQAYSLLGDRSQACDSFHQTVDAWQQIAASSSGIVPSHRSLQAEALREYQSCQAEKDRKNLQAR